MAATWLPRTLLALAGCAAVPHCISVDSQELPSLISPLPEGGWPRMSRIGLHGASDVCLLGWLMQVAG